jgi:hypothetical protein
MKIAISKLVMPVIIWACCFAGMKNFCKVKVNDQETALRKSPVSYHMSFDNRDFFNEDFIEQSGKKSVEERKIEKITARMWTRPCQSMLTRYCGIFIEIKWPRRGLICTDKIYKDKLVMKFGYLQDRVTKTPVH